MIKSIDVRHLNFKYDAGQEDYDIKDLSFSVESGEWISIVGHNGSGKSTTVRLLDGLLEAESGQIFIEGKELMPDNVWEIRQKIGLVFQNPDNQFVGATVEDDVAFGLENRGLNQVDMSIRVNDALKLVGMSDFSKREPARLSGGQKQRVAIAGALALQPDIIILDEATSMLDPKGRRELIQTIEKVRDQYGMTIVSITHDLDEVAMSDRVLVMKDGSLESISSPSQLFARKAELKELGLDVPFTSQVLDALKASDLDFQADYLNERDLETKLWEFISNK